MEPNKQTIRVLLVDDDFAEDDGMFNFYSDVGKMVAADHGWELVFFKDVDGQQGIKLFRKHHPQMIISDYQMPPGNQGGIEFLRAISSEMNSTVFHFATSCQDKGLDRQVEELGGIFHYKPLRFGDLEKIYQDLLSQDKPQA